MNIIYLKDENAIATFAFEWAEKKIKEVDAKSLYLPAGNTPIPLYALFEKTRPKWLEGKKIIQVDDILDGVAKGRFNKFFADKLKSYYQNVIFPHLYQPHQADLTILGLGSNGHIAFHEPHLPDDFDYGEVKLASQTKKDLGLPDNTRGITYGAKRFLQSKAILLIVVGSNKKRILRKLIKGLKCPASLLLSHSDLTIVCEESLKSRS
jgi:6-phosphogluconolactonase/glucosamine-6-phosphate isomerase/deaminase